MRIAVGFRYVFILALATYFACPAAAQQSPAPSAAAAKQEKDSPLQSFMNWSRELLSSKQKSPPIKPTIAAQSVAQSVAQASYQSPPPAASRTAIIELKKHDKLAEIVAATKGTVIVDFHAPWCGPCKKQGQVLKKLEPLAIKNGAKFVKIDIETHPDLAKQLNITSLPTMMVIKNGALIGMQSGLVNRETIAAHLVR